MNSPSRQPSIASQMNSNLVVMPSSRSQSFLTRDQLASPIGLFDSGVGGLSVYRHLQQTLPFERYMYYADTLHVPYGNRSQEDIRQLTLNAVDWLVKAGCKLVVIACNSASAYALNCARLRYPHIPIVGLVPALKPAVLQSKNKQVAVLATKATLEGDLLNQVIETYAKPHKVNVIKWCDPDLVPWVESGMPTSSPTATQLIQRLSDIHLQGVDQVVLGCTHYPFFREFLQQHIQNNKFQLSLVDSGQAIASRVQQLLLDQQSTQLNANNEGSVTPKPKPKSKSKNALSKDALKSDTFNSIKEKSLNENNLNENNIAEPKISNLQFYATKYDEKLKELVIRLVQNQNVEFV